MPLIPASRSNEFVVAASFPKEFRLQNIKDYEALEYFILTNTTARMLRSAGSKIVPSLASQWNASADMREFRFEMRDDAKFETGEPITVEDFAFALKRHFLGNGQYTFLYLPKLLGHESLQSFESQIPGIKIVDKKTIELRFIKPAPRFLEHLSMISFAVVRKKDASSPEPMGELGSG